jgi:pimeloyl-ACP methyl ester carboxylesterase
MKCILLLAAGMAAVSTWLSLAVRSEYGERIEVEGRGVRVRVVGEGAPTVVLENSGLGPLDTWGKVQSEVVRFARVFAYDHASTWGSDAGPKPRDAHCIAAELHATLHSAGLPPPYVLVGYSFGGPFIRVFAHRYPEEVAGMVFVDPSQEEAFEWLKVHHPEVNQISDAEAAEQDEWGCSWDSLRQAREAWPLPDVPVTLITCARDNGDPLLREALPVWLEAHKQFLGKLPHARHIVTVKNGHGVVFEDPLLVVDAIRDVVERARRGTAE